MRFFAAFFVFSCLFLPCNFPFTLIYLISSITIKNKYCTEMGLISLSCVKITYLADDFCPQAGLIGEHGLAVLLEAPGGTVLVDTGSGLALEHNAAALGVDFAHIDGIALTHGHNDHTGGLKLFLEKAGKSGKGRITVYGHQGIFQGRVKKNAGGKLGPTGIPFTQS